MLRSLLRTSGLLAFIAVVTVCTVAVILRGAGVGIATPAPGYPCAPGDVNGDGAVDISDPVALLMHLFQGAPLACAQTPPLSEEIASALAQFMPRNVDHQVFYNLAMTNQTEDILTVPAGKRFMLTFADLQTNTQLRLNGQPFFFPNGPMFPLDPGMTVSAYNGLFPLDDGLYRVYGHWVDLP